MKKCLLPLGEVSDAAYKKWYGLMSESRKARVDRLTRKDAKRRTVAGEIAARRAAAELLGIPPEEITLFAEPGGRPYAEGIYLSISHSGELAAAAADRSPVGIDVEKIRPVRLSAAKKVFTPEELFHLFGREPDSADFGRLPDPETLGRFFYLWTRHEAWVKRDGRGLRLTPEKKDDSLLETVRRDGYVISFARWPGAE